MIPDEIAPFEFEFEHHGQLYYFDTYRILKDGSVVCRCDLTGTKYHGDELVTLICCKVALEAYNTGKQAGILKHKTDVSDILKNLIIM